MKKALLSAAVLSATFSTFAQAEEVNVYSFRQEFLLKPLLEAFTEETGIKVNVVFSKSGLLERLEHEGQNTPADLLLTADIGPLYDATERDLVAPIKSDIIEQNIPEHFRATDGRWVGLTSRARLIYASKDRVEPGEITTYEELADPKWKGRICTRSGKHTYNLSLIGSMIAHHGEAETEQWLEGVKANLAQKPQGNDRSQVKAIMEGVCDLALGNSYYYGKMATNEDEPEQKEWAASANLVFPNQDDRGTHMNISGAALTKYAPHPEAAVKLVEFLTQEKAQKLYAEANFEFPVRPNTPWSELLEEKMSGFKGDEINLGEIGANRAAAAKLVDKVGFDN
ncbi:Fe(3+) ABC transporter substrate-binding protein [Marinobacterium lutimaris]|uniref:Iron(III) transport system substrate-binding protein n=1 Tax=Marinobacterium lutimaris TaxID=568106 RepID=A0A1H6CC32_9GAMM|nr:Fe(3+) ABC transporter substrate-binding protein [Marinobacterium lutimaris]SEG70442.1 iron(III) transport system substrate-binding protein [Marinobacterium lutimaris]